MVVSCHCALICGGWTTTYMMEVRHGNPNTMGYVSTGFWTGIAVGRIVLGFISGKIGHLELMVAFYLVAAAVFSLLYWLIPELIVSAVSAGCLGVFLGPLYPTMTSVAVKKIPRWLQVSSIGFISAFGGGGAASVPFLCGGLIQAFGPYVLGPIIFTAVVGQLILWLFVVIFF